MDIILIIINVTVLVAIIGLLIFMQKKHISFTKRVFAALGMGIVLGALLQAIYGAGSTVLSETVSWYSIVGRDRKSTRLNSSHVAISYAVFCLKKKSTTLATE